MDFATRINIQHGESLKQLGIPENTLALIEVAYQDIYNRPVRLIKLSSFKGDAEGDDLRAMIPNYVLSNVKVELIKYRQSKIYNGEANGEVDYYLIEYFPFTKK